jgi:prepilin-type N-terminal cleavage/methylation domain-containing protein
MNKKSLPAGRQGFTLIELLVVIAIIGLLASIILVSVNNARDKAKVVKAKAELKQIATAAEMDYDDNGNYAPDVSPGGIPRFVPTYINDIFSGGAKYYCSTCVLDWQNWGSGCIIIDLYQTPSGPVIHRLCIYTPNCSCSSF